MSEQSKQKIREKLRSSRQLLKPEEVGRHSQRMSESIMRLVEWGEVRRFHCYAAAAGYNEPETRALLEYVWRHHPTIATYTPIVRSKEMLSSFVDAKTVWRPGELSIPEPVRISPAPKATQYDVIIVPLLGFNQQGYRIGYGGGYYDKFLATQPDALTIGLCYEAGLVEFTPEPYDIPLRVIVTEQSIIKYS